MTINSDPGDGIEVGQNSATGQIEVNFGPCTPVAPIASTTSIVINGDTGDEFVGIEMWDNAGPGTDLVDWGTINFSVTMGSGTDDVLYIDGFSVVGSDMTVDVGASGIDLNGDGDNDVTYDSGTDSIDVDTGDGDDTVNAGGSTATGAATAVPIAIEGGDGDDTLTGGAESDNSSTTSFGDNIQGGNGDDVLAGGLGDDTLQGDAGQDTADFSGSATAVNANLTTGNATGQGLDTLTTIEDLVGSAQGDTLTGSATDNVITGAAGDDKIDCVGAATDEDTAGFSDSAAGVTVDLTAGTATGDGTDTLKNCEDVQGSGFDDTIMGDSNDNALFGGAGIDSISGGTATDDSDIIDGGAGSDWVDYSARTDPVTVDFTKSVNTAAGNTAGACNDGPGGANDEFVNGDVAGGEADCINAVENAALGTGDDTFVGSAFNNTVQPGGGQNSLAGGTGGDTLDYSVGYTAGVTVNLAGGAASDDAIDSFENVIGTAFADSITGDDSSNTLKSRKGNDNVRGGAGDDTVKAGAGNDLVRGGTGDDDLWGQKGNDSLNGGKGADFCKGGPGKDVLKSCESGHK